MACAFSTPLAEVATLEPKALKALAKAGFCEAGDLLSHYPRRYEDRRKFDGFPFGETTDPVCLHAMVTDGGLRKMGFRKYVEIRLEDADENPLAPPIFCRWFHMPWLARAFAAGQEIVVFGKVKGRRDRLVMDHPDYELIETRLGEPSIHMDRVVPVYPLRDGLQQKVVREAVHAVLEELTDDSVFDLLPPNALDAGEAAAGLTRARALRDIHFPRTMEIAQTARRYLALEEFFALQLNVLHRRKRLLQQPGTVHGADGAWLEQWEKALRFPLTGAQKRSIAEIRRDLLRGQPMNRLLQGDVGSGKTFVALASALIAAESGFQTAIMAPTQILAEQHHRNFQKHMEPLGLRVDLRTGARREETNLPLFQAGADTPHVVVGTHALLFEHGLFDRLGLVIIDEQHKFGVAQRAKLLRQGKAPDVLVMTATPIPRTLALTLYGDLDVSVLDEMPAGRGKITTAVRSGVDLQQVAEFIRVQVNKGRQAYIVYPLVEESDKLEVKAATTEFEAWQKRLADVPMGLMHGRLKPEEKDRVMSAFRSGETRVLVSTTVVEVGVDVPNANLILIFNAERFGLAQLHQLRGRVGRGAHHSYCVLVVHEDKREAFERLKILEHTRDGFEIAEADLKLRGPGELLGEKQSGLPDLRLGDLAADAVLVHRARELAAAVLDRDPDLLSPAHRHLRPLLLPEEQALSAAN